MLPSVLLCPHICTNKEQNSWSVDALQYLPHKGITGLCSPSSLYWLIFLIWGDSVKCELTETDKTIHSNPCAHCPPQPPNFSCSLFEYVQSCIELWGWVAHSPIHSQREEAGRREAIDCVTFPQVPGCEGSLWVRLSVEDSGTCTWKDSVYKAAGAGGESCTGLRTPLLCPADSLPMHVLLSLSLLPLHYSFSSVSSTALSQSSTVVTGSGKQCLIPS